MTTELAPLPVGSGGPAAVTVRGPTKRYGGRPVLHRLGPAVRRGECFALRGPNGAGRTTSIEILEGVRRRDGGDVEVPGEDPAVAGRGWQDRIGVVARCPADLPADLPAAYPGGGRPRRAGWRG